MIDKKQLIFGVHQYNGSFAVTASSSESYYMKIDFQKKYNTVHLIIVGKANMMFKVYNGNKQQLTEEINLVEGEVKEIDVDLQGSQAVNIYAYGSDGYPLVCYADGTFRPSANITHAEMISMVVRASGLSTDQAGSSRFKDDESIPKWAKAAVLGVRAVIARGNRIRHWVLQAWSTLIFLVWIRKYTRIRRCK